MAKWPRQKGRFVLRCKAETILYVDRLILSITAAIAAQLHMNHLWILCRLSMASLMKRVRRLLTITGTNPFYSLKSLRIWLLLTAWCLTVERCTEHKNHILAQIRSSIESKSNQHCFHAQWLNIQQCLHWMFPGFPGLHHIINGRAVVGTGCWLQARSFGGRKPSDSAFESSAMHEECTGKPGRMGCSAVTFGPAELVLRGSPFRDAQECKYSRKVRASHPQLAMRLVGPLTVWFIISGVT